MIRFQPILTAFSSLLSGEFIFLKGRNANGGDVVILRAIWVTVYITALTLWLRNGLDEYRGCHFSSSVLLADLKELSGWIAAAFGGIYAAFYSRFAAQWSYLANMYNQIKQAEVTQSDLTISSIPLAQWKAGFIEDALDLHLASKASISGIICAWAQDPAIESAFTQYTPGGLARWAHVLQLANKAKSKVEAKWNTVP